MVMNLVKWKPFGELEQFRKEMNNLFSDFFGEGALVPSFGKGVLKITFPKTEEAKTKEIKIEVNPLRPSHAQYN
jgi:hypothetical protein